MALFRKQPVEVEAVQLNWTNWSEICEFLGNIISDENPARNVDRFSSDCGEEGPFIELTIPTLEGNHVASHGDWIIKGVKGEFYPCKPDIFDMTYEPVLSPISKLGSLTNLKKFSTTRQDILEEAVQAALAADPDRPGVSTYDESGSRYSTGYSHGVSAAVAYVRQIMKN